MKIIRQSRYKRSFILFLALSLFTGVLVVPKAAIAQESLTEGSESEESGGSESEGSESGESGGSESEGSESGESGGSESEAVSYTHLTLPTILRV